MNWQEEFDNQFNKPISERAIDAFHDPSSKNVYLDLSDIKAFIQSLLDQHTKRDDWIRLSLHEELLSQQKKELLQKIKLHLPAHHSTYSQAIRDLEKIKKQLSEEAEIP
jgi:DNA-binding transcriptional MerR regulator